MDAWETYILARSQPDAQPPRSGLSGRSPAGGSVSQSRRCRPSSRLWESLGLSACGQEPPGASPAASELGAATHDGAGDDGLPPLICGTASPPARPSSTRVGPPVIITDRQSHDWDISTAVYKYGFEPQDFDYGLGVNVIRPIVQPVLLAPGDADYPGDGEDFSLVGIELTGEARAYPIDILTRHEIVNDVVGGAHLAVSY